MNSISNLVSAVAVAGHTSPVKTRVYIWIDAGRWSEWPECIPTGDCSSHAGEEIGSFEFSHHYGPILGLRDTVPVDRPMLARRHHEGLKPFRYVKVSVDTPFNEGRADAETKEVVIFYGVVVSANDRPEENRTDYACMDLKWLLAGIKNDLGYFEVNEFSPGGGSNSKEVGKRMKENAVFNDGQFGPDADSTMIASKFFEMGNRSGQRYDPDTVATFGDQYQLLEQTSDFDKGVWIFGGPGGTFGSWTHQDMLEYFLKLFINKRLPKDLPIEFKVANAHLLGSIVLPEVFDVRNTRLTEFPEIERKISRLDLRNKPMHECIDEIVRASGDFTWTLDVTEEEGGKIVATITVRDKSVPVANRAAANLASPQGVVSYGAVVDVDAKSARRTPRAGPIKYDSSARVNRLIVVGARRKYITTLANFRCDSAGTPTLVPGWTTADETALKAVLTKSAKGAQKEACEEACEKYDEVYRRFVIPSNLQWNDVEALTTSDPSRRRLMFPVFVLEDGPDGKVERRYETQSQISRMFGEFVVKRPKKLLPKLFIKAGYTYGAAGVPLNPPTPDTLVSGTPLGTGEYMKSLVWSVNVKQDLTVVRRLLGGLLPDFPDPPLVRLKDVQELEDTAGVKMSHFNQNVTDNPFSAKIDLSGRSEVQHESATKLWPYHLETIGTRTRANDSWVRKKNYEAWKTLAFTVCLESDDRPMYVVEDKAALDRGDPVRELVIENEEFQYWECRDALVDDDGGFGGNPLVLGEMPYVLRNDFERLKVYANRTFAKLKQEKIEATLGYDYVDLTFRPGDYVTRVRAQDVNAIVMSVVTHPQDQTTTVVTQYDAAGAMEDLR